MLQIKKRRRPRKGLGCTDYYNIKDRRKANLKKASVKLLYSRTKDRNGRGTDSITLSKRLCSHLSMQFLQFNRVSAPQCLFFTQSEANLFSRTLFRNALRGNDC